MAGTVVHVSDTVPPEIVSASAEPACLWPPNHDLVRYAVGQQIQVEVQDACDPHPSVSIVNATSSEPALTPGSGETTPDVFVGSEALCLRSERSGTGDGRTYTIAVQATNVNGLTSPAVTVAVTVPHDEGAASRCPALSPDQLLADGDPLCSFTTDGGAATTADPSGVVRSAGCSSAPGTPGDGLLAFLLGLASCVRVWRWARR